MDAHRCLDFVSPTWATCLLCQGEAKTCSHWSPKQWSCESDKWLAFRKASSFGCAALVTGLTPPSAQQFGRTLVLPTLRCASRFSSDLPLPLHALVLCLPASYLSSYTAPARPYHRPSSHFHTHFLDLFNTFNSLSTCHFTSFLTTSAD